MKRRVIISLISPPGGGKTTILKHLSDTHQLPILSSGDIARQMQEDIESNFLLQGGFAPEEEMRRRLLESIETLFGSSNVILADGFPRFIDQLEWLENSLGDVDIVLYHLDIPLEKCKNRLQSRNRSDDNEDTVEARFRQYVEQTEPIVAARRIRHYNYDFVTQVILATKKN